MPDANQSSHPVLSYTDGLAESSRDILLLFGRVAVGWIYMQSGWAKLVDIMPFVKSMPRRGLPEYMGYVGPPVEFIGGVMLLLGVGTRYAALMLLAFTIVASFSSHAFWAFTTAQDRATHFTHFFKNLTMKGGLLLLFVTGPGRFSLDGLLRRK